MREICTLNNEACQIASNEYHCQGIWDALEIDFTLTCEEVMVTAILKSALCIFPHPVMPFWYMPSRIAETSSGHFRLPLTTTGPLIAEGYIGTYLKVVSHAKLLQLKATCSWTV